MIEIIGARTCEELKHENTKRPVVGADVVTPVQDHLGGDVFRGATEGPSLATMLEVHKRSLS